MSDRFRVIVYDRRGTPRSPLGAGSRAVSVGEHAEDAARVLREHAVDGPALVCGSSFGAVCLLELMGRGLWPMRGAILCEPPLAVGDEPLFSSEQWQTYERLRQSGRGLDAAELFMRAVLGAAYDRLSPVVRARSLALHEAVALDTAALVAYDLDEAALARVDVPVLLLGGDRSPPLFRRVLERLAAVLPRAELRILPGASHVMHADSWRAFNDEIVRFAHQVGHLEDAPGARDSA